MGLRAWRAGLWWLSGGVAVLGIAIAILTCFAPIVWLDPSGRMISANRGTISLMDWTPIGTMPSIVNGPPAGISIGAQSGNMTITAASVRVGKWPGAVWKWSLGIAATLSAIGIMLWIQERRRKRIGGLCVHCGYDVRGLKACPECGRSVANAEGASRSNR